MQEQVKITDINQEGQGVGRAESGLIYFVDGGLPGEVVTVTATKKTPRYAVAKIDSIDTVSPDRIPPLCPVAHLCGGCHLQHLTYGGELTWKVARVRQAITRIGKFDLNHVDVRPIIGMEKPWGYRNKASYPLASIEGYPALGFYAVRSHKLIKHDGCPIVSESMNTAKSLIENLIRRDKIDPYNEKTHTGTLRHVVVRQSMTDNSLMVMFVVKERDPAIELWPSDLAASLKEKGSDGNLASAYVMQNKNRGNTIFGEKPVLLFGSNTIRERLNGLTFQLRPEAFFQVNTEQAEKLFAIVTEWAKECFCKSVKKQVLDLYCGSGTIALHVARAGLAVTGVEIVDAAILQAKENAQINRINNANFISADAVEYVEKYGVDDIGLIVLDPPRKGCDDRLIDALLKADSIENIIYVSCNPATLARDLERLKEKYSLRRVQPIDMFPHTTHVETVVLMSRK